MSIAMGRCCETGWQSRQLKSKLRFGKGLFWHHRGYRLPEGYAVHAASKEAIRHSEGMRGAKMVRSAKELAKEPPFRVRTGQVFHYRHKFWNAEDPNVSAWLLVFFTKFIFLTATERAVA
jgi:hypothetical protein